MQNSIFEFLFSILLGQGSLSGIGKIPYNSQPYIVVTHTCENPKEISVVTMVRKDNFLYVYIIEKKVYFQNDW